MLIAPFSDTHIKIPGKLAYGRVDTATMLQASVAHLAAMQPQPDLLLITGDLVDLGRPAEYEYLRSLLTPLRMPMLVLVIAGNHDERQALREAFADEACFPASGFMHPLRPSLGLAPEATPVVVWMAIQGPGFHPGYQEPSPRK